MVPALLVECWVLVLVAFAFRRKLDAARWLLAIAAMLVNVLQAVHDWGDAGARWTHWTIADPLALPLFTVAGNTFNAGTLADTLLLASILYAVWRYETEQRNRQTLLDEEFRNAQEWNYSSADSGSVLLGLEASGFLHQRRYALPAPGLVGHGARPHHL